ncbi:MAG: hypothetical protein ACK56F_02950, partial [bacterium]
MPGGGPRLGQPRGAQAAAEGRRRRRLDGRRRASCGRGAFHRCVCACRCVCVRLCACARVCLGIRARFACCISERACR